MELSEIVQAIFQYGGTVIMAGLFVWVFVQDKTKNTKLLEEIKEVVKALTVSNENIAKSLEIISSNCSSVDKKIDRNYEAILKGGKRDE